MLCPPPRFSGVPQGENHQVPPARPVFPKDLLMRRGGVAGCQLDSTGLLSLDPQAWRQRKTLAKIGMPSDLQLARSSVS